MITMKDQSLSVYRGDYRPVDVLRNGQQIGGWKTTGMVGDEGEFYGTYHDLLQVYGKSGYRESVNLCPPPTAIHDSDDLMELIVTPKAEGRFDLSIATNGSDVVMLMSPIVVHSVTLPAGTYTASSNSSKIRFCSENEFVYNLPHTFTLATAQRVSFGFYDTDFSETDLYLQIEAGTAATAYDPYAGDPTKEPSPENVRPLVSAQGQIMTRGKNLFNADLASATNLQYGITADYEGDGVFHIYGTLQPNYGFNLPSFALNLPCEKDTVYTWSTELISGYTEVPFYPYLGVGETTERYYNFISTKISPEMKPRTVWASSNKPASITAVSDPKYIVRFWVYFYANEGKKVDCRIRNWLEERSGSATYIPYVSPVTVDVPALRGVPTDAQRGGNYQESGQWYISDELRGAQLLRRIGELTLDGSEGLQQAPDDFANVYRYYWEDGAVFREPKSSEMGLCNMLKRLNTATADEEGILFGNDDQNIYLCFAKDRFSSVDAVKQWLAKQAESGNPLTIYYPMEEPTTEQLSDNSSLTTLPRYTKLAVTTKKGTPSLGLSQCIKTQI